MMDGSGLSVADAIALERNGNNCGCNGGMWGDSGIWMLFFLFLLAGGGWGRNGWGGVGSNSPDFQGYATRADINDGFALNNLQSGITGIQQGICDSTYALNNTIQNGFSNAQLQLCNGFANVTAQMNNIGYQLQQCLNKILLAIKSIFTNSVNTVGTYV